MFLTKQLMFRFIVPVVNYCQHRTNYKILRLSSMATIKRFYTLNIFKYPINNESNIKNNEIIRNKIVKLASTNSIYKQNELNNALIHQIKKRTARKKRSDEITKDDFNVLAFATAEEYNLEKLMTGLLKQDLYQPKSFFSTDNFDVEPDVLYVKAKYPVGHEEREIFFFREGTVVFWNVTELESSNVLQFLKPYETNPYDDLFVQNESEIMSYNYKDNGSIASLKGEHIYLSKDNDMNFEKYTFSNALSLSVKLGIWEASLNKYINSMEFITDDLKSGKRINMTRSDVLKKTGELFELRHLLNLSSDLLDTPDFYWDREQLEALYLQIYNYLSISRRTKVMNEKLNHCIELAELISTNLNDKHHIRLEWMIIILIMVEVGFEILHYADRFLDKHSENNIHENKKNVLPDII